MDAHDARIQHLADRAEAFCARWYRNDPQPALLVLTGMPGCGKTHTLRAVAKFCRASSVQSFDTKVWGCAKFPNVFSIAWPECTRSFASKEFGIVQDCFDADLLTIDDLGAENDPWTTSADIACQILSRRERKFTVITTNIRPNEWNSKFDVRTADRLFRNSEIVDLSDVPSYSMR